MKLYHFPYSFNSRRAVMTAYLCGFQPEIVPVDLPRRAQREPAYLAINPKGRVPALDDEGFVITESFAIMTYLADKARNPSLYPTEARARTDVHQWMFWAAYEWNPPIRALTTELFLKKFFNLGEADPVQVERQGDVFRERAEVLDAHLAKNGRAWVSGDALTLADVAIATTLGNPVFAQLPLQGLAHVERWFASVRALDAWKQTEPPPFPTAG